jgi:phosphate transport system protein
LVRTQKGTRVTHLEETLQRDIDRIGSKFQEMATLVDVALKGCLRAMAETNRQLAYSVILRDQRIDELEKEIDRLSLEFIVRQQPVGRHLRFAYAAIKINSQLERVGDYAESMARQILLLQNLDTAVPTDLFAPIANLAIPMVRSAAEAFTKQSAELAQRTMENEDAVDQMRHQLSHELLEMRQAGRIPLEALAPLHNILNRFERVADQAKAISQDVLYLCTGEYVKHLGSDVYRMLFVDDSNTSLSQIAEAVGNSLKLPSFVFSSAGLERQSVDAQTMAFLRKKGLDVARQNSKSLEQIPYLDQYQIIVALSKDAQSVFPPPPTKVVCLDWSSANPMLEGGSGEDNEAALERTYRFLLDHIKDLAEAVVLDDRS